MIDWERYQRLKLEKFFPAQFIELPEDPAERRGEEARRVLLAQWLLAKASGGLAPERLASVAGLPVDDAVAWCELPLLVEGSAKASIFPVLLGLLPHPAVRIEPGWLCPDAEEAVRQALCLAGQGMQGFVLLCRDVRPDAGIGGASLGLPLALAGRRLAEGALDSVAAMSTGALDAHGAVHAVGAVRLKYERALKTKRSFFLYPQANEADMPPAAERACAVATLDEALALCGLDGADGGVLGLLSGWRKAPHGFFSWLDSGSFVPSALPALLSHAESAGWLLGMPDGTTMGDAVDSLNRWREKRRPDDGILRRLAAFFPLAKVQSLHPLSRLRLAGMNMTLDSHRGRHSPAWRQVLLDALREIKKEGMGSLETDMEEITAVVRSVVIDGHNAYRFHEPPPSEWLDLVNEYTRLCRKRSNANLALGKAYGMLTQQEAFAGDLAEALEKSELSLAFLADDREKQRRWIDRTYILCDMGRSEAAARELSLALASCLGGSREEPIVPNGTSIADCENPFVHAAFVRLCLSVPALFAGYPVEEILKRPFEQGHPWQCWACNCGRLLASSSPALARTCLHKAIGICLHDEEEATLTPMALLSLSALAHLRLEPMEQVCQIAQEALVQLRELCRNGQLCAEHFQTVLEAGDTASALEAVEREQARLFPFNYR